MLRIVGDVNFSDGYWDTGFGVGSMIKKGLDPFAGVDMKSKDFWIGNFECVCSTISNKTSLKSKQFRVDPYVLKNIRHLNLYSVANNHVMQHGEEAYNQMLLNIKNFGSDYVGSLGKKIHTFSHEGKVVSILSFSMRPDEFSESPLYWCLPEYKEIEKEFQKILNSDYKIAYIHWGNEYINHPYIDQVQFAHWLVDLGFDLIVGMHPHILQSYEIYKGKFIFYSIGNFVFNMAWEPTKYSVIINVDLNNNNVSFDYVKIGDGYSPVCISTVPENYNLRRLCYGELKKETNEIYYKKVFNGWNLYRRANHLSIMRNIKRFDKKDISLIFEDFFKRRLINKLKTN